MILYELYEKYNRSENGVAKEPQLNLNNLCSCMVSSHYKLFIYCEEFSHRKWGNGLENILNANSVSEISFQSLFFFFSQVPINSRLFTCSA